MLNEEFNRLVLAERERDFARTARRHVEAAEALAATAESVVLRLCRVDDDPALELLAVLSGGDVAPGRYVLAEVDGAIVAGLPISGGDPITDPFRPTSHLMPLLRLRAEQLSRPARSRSWLMRLWPATVH
jgi:hypothetical protein